MREIKFRAWGHLVRANYCMHYCVSIEDYLCNPLPYVGDGDKICDHELMQYTGLKDKNGKEIYEGDIVKCGWFYGDDFGNEVGEMEFSNQVVEFTVGQQGSGFDLNVFGMENAEIIGNMYENPELLI